MPVLSIIICVWLKYVFEKDIQSQFRGIKRGRTRHLVCPGSYEGKILKNANWNVWHGYYHPFSAKLEKKKIIIGDFLFISMVQMHSLHLVGFFWFWSDKEVKMGTLELYTLFHDRFQQRHLQREVVFATSFRHPLSALFLIVSCWKPVLGCLC